MQFLKKYKGILFIVLAAIACFIVANQFRVANGGQFVSGVMYFRYAGYFFIVLLLFRIGVKAKLLIIHNLAMVAMILIGLEILFYAMLGAPIRENKGFGMPDLEKNDIQIHTGYLPAPDTVINEVLVVEGDTSFNVDYTTDEFRKRVTPKNDTVNSEYALFFGCSIAYGYGLEDDQTIPYNYQSNGDIASYNFAYNGHGTNHVAARLENQDLSKQVVEKDGKAFYLFFWDHIARAIGTMKRHTSWLHFAPYYYIEDDTLKREGMFKDGRPVTSYFYESVYQSSILEYFEVDFPLSINETHYELVAEMIKNSKNLYSKQFGNDSFYVVLLPSYNKIDASEFDKFVEIVQSKGVEIVDLSEMVEYGPKYTLNHDPHPNAEFSKLLSKTLYNSIK